MQARFAFVFWRDIAIFHINIPSKQVIENGTLECDFVDQAK